MRRQEPPPGYRWIFRPFRRLKDGRMLWARTYGYKAWRMLVKIA
jgi:hypothetical protein